MPKSAVTLTKVFHAASCAGGDRTGKAEAFLYKFTLALLKFANRRGRLLQSSDGESFFRNLAECCTCPSIQYCFCVLNDANVAGMGGRWWIEGT